VLPRASRTRPALRALLALLIGLATGCGDGNSSPESPTRLEEALAKVGDAVSARGTGYGWVDLGAVRTGGRAVPAWAAQALGPGAAELVYDRAKVRARTGLDPGAATEALAVGGSYTFAARFDGVETGRLRALYARAGATSRELRRWRAFDVGPQAQAPLGTPLEALESLGARAAVQDGAAILARTDPTRLALIGGGEPPTSDAQVGLAVDCLDEVVAARLFRGSFTQQPRVSPDLVAVGVRAPAGAGPKEVLCAIDDSEDAVEGYAESMRRALAPGARNPDTEERLPIASSNVDTFADGGEHAARTQLRLTAGARPGLLFDALVLGTIVAYIGGPAPG
jgi:hypothetical protein